jgi:hypothetical protein
LGSAFLPLQRPSAAVNERLRDVLGAEQPDTLWLAAARAAMDGRFEEAAEVFARMPFRHAEACARMRAADRLVEAGRRAEADAQRRQALALWRSVGATRYIRQAETLFAATA